MWHKYSTNITLELFIKYCYKLQQGSSQSRLLRWKTCNYIAEVLLCPDTDCPIVSNQLYSVYIYILYTGYYYLDIATIMMSLAIEHPKNLETVNILANFNRPSITRHNLMRAMQQTITVTAIPQANSQLFLGTKLRSQLPSFLWAIDLLLHPSCSCKQLKTSPILTTIGFNTLVVNVSVPIAMDTGVHLHTSYHNQPSP